MQDVQERINLFEVLFEMISSLDLEVGVFSAINKPEQARSSCHQYSKILEQYGFSNIAAADSSAVLSPGVHIVYIQDKKTNLFIGSGRLHLGISGVELPIEKVLSDVDSQLKAHINSQKSELLIAELSGFWVDRNYRNHFPLSAIVRLVIGLSIGVALRYNRKKLICLSSRHVLASSLFFDFKKIDTFGNNGKIFYPTQNYSYYMECIVENLPFIRKDAWKLICWAKDNLL